MRKGFSTFRSLRNEPKPGRTSDVGQDNFRKLVKWSLRKSTRKLELDLNTYQFIICWLLKKTAKVSQLNVLAPLTLSEKNKEDRISIATIILSLSFMTMFNAKGSRLTRVDYSVVAFLLVSQTFVPVWQLHATCLGSEPDIPGNSGRYRNISWRLSVSLWSAFLTSVGTLALR